MKLCYTHRVQVGINPLKEYGLALARTVKFPRKVIPKAEEILERIKNLRVNELISTTRSTGMSGTLNSSSNLSREKMFYDLYASVVSICRRVCVDDISVNVEEDLKGILREFSGKCSQDFRDSIRNLSLEENFNQSTLFARNLNDTLNESDRNQSPMREDRRQMEDDEEDVIPETPQLTQLSNVTNVTNTSWMTEIEKVKDNDDMTIISELSYHSLLRRLAEKRKSDSKDNERFNEHKGFQVLPFVKPLRSQERVDVEIINKDLNSRKESPEIFMDNFKEIPETPESINNYSIINQRGLLPTNNVQAGGDNRLLVESQGYLNKNIIQPDCDHKTSFFDHTINGDELWSDLQSQMDEEQFKFDSPEQLNNTQKFFSASQFAATQEENIYKKNIQIDSPNYSFRNERFVKKTGRNIPCTITSNDLPKDNEETFKFDQENNDSFKNYFSFEESPETIQLEKDILNDLDNNNDLDDLNISFPSPQKDFLLTQRSQEICDSQLPSSNNSNYNFRLGLLDRNKLQNTVVNTPPPDKLNYASPSASSTGTVRSEPHSFIVKYGKIIQDNYRKSQSQQQPLKKPVDPNNGAKEFLEKYGGKIMEQKLFKQPPPVTFPLPSSSRGCITNTQSPSNPRHFNMNSTASSISSIHSNEPEVTKKDYSGWLAQYCKSRAMSLGMPKNNRKRPHNSTMKSNRSKMDIDLVNRRWESYYTEYNNNVNDDDSKSEANSNSTFVEKRVSFYGDDEDFNKAQRNYRL